METIQEFNHMLSNRQHGAIFAPEPDPDTHAFYPEIHPFDVLFDEVRTLGVNSLGERVMTEAAGRILGLHLPTQASRTKCFSLILELRTPKLMGTARETTITLTPMQKVGVKKACSKRYEEDFDSWVTHMVDSGRLVIEQGENEAEVWTVRTSIEEMNSTTFLISCPIEVRKKFFFYLPLTYSYLFDSF